MRRRLQLLGLSGLLSTFATLSTPAFAQGLTDAEEDPRQSTEKPKEAEQPTAVLPAEPVPPPAAPVVAPPPKPKFGDVAVSGYFRGNFGASNHQGRMTCFSLALPGELRSKYRLGNECEVWSETHFTVVTFAGQGALDGVVATAHFMPTIYIPTTFIGYTPNGTINSPLQYTTSTGATLSFPNLYADISGISWLFGGTVWAGTRYYKRESIYISDFFYWNPSGVGAGVEDINLGKNLRLSYAAFAVDGRLTPPPEDFAPPLAPLSDFGVRNDLQLRGIKFWESGEFQLGFQYIANYSNNASTSGGWGATFRYVQKMLGGDNKFVVQYGRGAGTGFGTLARYYYPDFSLYNAPGEFRVRLVDVLTIQPGNRWFGAQVGLVYQRDDLGNAGQITNWYSGGARVSFAFTEHFKLLGEAGYDRVTKSNGSPPQYLGKFTVAPTISTGHGLLTRPELRLFFTWAVWNEAARIATIDSGMLFTNSIYLRAATFGVQAETWW
jgi:maltoporin